MGASRLLQKRCHAGCATSAPPLSFSVFRFSFFVLVFRFRFRFRFSFFVFVFVLRFLFSICLMFFSILSRLLGVYGSLGGEVPPIPRRGSGGGATPQAWFPGRVSGVGVPLSFLFRFVFVFVFRFSFSFWNEMKTNENKNETTFWPGS